MNIFRNILLAHREHLWFRIVCSALHAAIQITILEGLIQSVDQCCVKKTAANIVYDCIFVFVIVILCYFRLSLNRLVLFIVPSTHFFFVIYIIFLFRKNENCE